MQRAPSIRLAHVIPRWALVYMLSHSHCLGYTSKLCGCGVPCSPAWRRQWAPLRAARSQPSRRGFPPSSPLATRCVAVPYTLKRSPSRSDGTDPAPHTPAQLFRPAMLVVDWYLLHDRQYGAAGGSFVVTHAAALAALLDAALITNVGGRGALSAVATAHVVLLCASEHNASVLRAALVHALVVLIGGAADAAADEHSDLLLASFAGLLGRCLLCAPALFSAALGGAAEALRIPDPLPRFVARWHRGHRGKLGSRAAQTPLPEGLTGRFRASLQARSRGLCAALARAQARLSGARDGSPARCRRPAACHGVRRGA